jgi:hypothetical protein
VILSKSDLSIRPSLQFLILNHYKYNNLEIEIEIEIMIELVANANNFSKIDKALPKQ